MRRIHEEDQRKAKELAEEIFQKIFYFLFSKIEEKFERETFSLWDQLVSIVSEREE